MSPPFGFAGAPANAAEVLYIAHLDTLVQPTASVPGAQHLLAHGAAEAGAVQHEPVGAHALGGEHARPARRALHAGRHGATPALLHLVRTKNTITSFAKHNAYLVR